MTDTEKIAELIRAQFPEARISVDGSDGKYTATVVSEQFAGHNAVKRHQMVYMTVSEQITSGALHALSIRAHTPDEVE